MNRITLNHASQSRSGLGVVELQMDEYNMDDLAGEIARALAACQEIADESVLTGNDGGDVAVSR